MERAEVEDVVEKAVRATLNICTSTSVSTDDNLVELFHADSLDLVEVIMEVDAKLGINIPDSKIRFIDIGSTSINNIVDVALEEIQTNG